MREKDILDYYSSVKVKTISGRYHNYENWQKHFLAYDSIFKTNLIGKSVLDKSIYKIQIGTGNTKVLIWSQMHGNESTTTKALLDFIEHCKNVSQEKDYLQKLSLHIIPIVNPDGCDAYTRFNANKIDLNRDAADLSQPESKILRKVFASVKPDFCFNLHDQRSIFSAGDNPLPATLSFLAPAFNKEKQLNQSRLKAMQVISGINNSLQQVIPGQVGRYDDTFNPNCVGDSFQAAGASTILFEAGQYKLDYQREETRKFVFLSILQALQLINDKSYDSFTEENYTNIPQNQKLFLDLILRNVSYENKITDVGIQYKECLLGNKLEFLPFIKYIDNLELFYAHRELEGNKTKITVNNSSNFRIGTEIQNLATENGISPINLTIP